MNMSFFLSAWKWRRRPGGFFFRGAGRRRRGIVSAYIHRAHQWHHGVTLEAGARNVCTHLADAPALLGLVISSSL